MLGTTAALLAIGFGPTVAGASADGSVTLPGSPLSVSVGSLGECQSSYPNVGVNFYPPFGTVGDCGFFLGFSGHAGQPPNLKETVFGFEGAAGPHITGATGGILYTAIAQGAPTGSGTATDPYTQVTTFKVRFEEEDYALVTVTTTYVNGQAQFTSTYDVHNITGTPPSGSLKPAPSATLYFHAIVAGDLFVANDDHGTGVFLGGPPRFIGGQNAHTGTLGGFVEAGPPSPAWTNYQEGYWDGPFVPAESTDALDKGIWNAVRESATANEVFNGNIDPALIDNGAGVSWDDHLSSGLAAGAHATFSIVNRTQVPTTLSVQPVKQTLTVGQTGTITITATDNVGTPYAGRPLVYSIGGANPKSGSVTTNSSGQATISYVGTKAGIDTIQMFLDLAGTGVQASQDPASSAQITWTPPLPNSSYKIQSIHANSDGSITITFVPAQAGQATLVVTVPTGTISRHEANAAKKSKKCKKGQIKIKGKCRPATTVTGKVSATGAAGVPLKLTVKPSAKIRSLLSKGKTVHLTATLTYKSALGGAPTVHAFHVTVKGKRKGHKKH